MASQVKPRNPGESFFKPPRVFPKRSANGFPIGKQTKRRIAENRELNKLPDAVKRRCELRIPGVCIGNKFLSWAHSRKARFLTTARDWQEAARSCAACHLYAESLSHLEMHKLVTEAISRRKI